MHDCGVFRAQQPTHAHVLSSRSSWQQQLLLEAERDTGLVMPGVLGAMPSQRDIMQELRQKQQELRMASV